MGFNFKYYEYSPSTAAAVLFTAIYVVETILLAYQIIRYRAWIWVIFLVASLMELVGYAARIESSKNITKMGPFAVQLALIVLAPILIAAALYVTFGRIIWHTLPKDLRKFRLLWVPPRFITPIFVGCDILAFLLQAFGAIDFATATASDISKINTGKNVVLVGLAIQLACFGYFILCSIRAQWILGQYMDLIYQNRNVKIIDNGKKYEARNGKANKVQTYIVNWKILLAAVNIASLLVLVRTIYRVVEFALGRNGYANTHEWTFYIFDTLPIFICFVIFNILHPGKYLQNLGFRGGRSDIWADEGTRERMDMAGDVDLETTDAQEEGNKR